MSNQTNSMTSPPSQDSASLIWLVDIGQVAAMLGISRRSIYRRVHAGDMPAPVKIGHHTRWRADELRRWCEAGCPAAKGADQ